MATLTILFATEQGEETPSVEISFPEKTVEEVTVIGNTIRVGGTPYPWVTYVFLDEVIVVTPEGFADGDVSGSVPGV
jgi:hypothetical protein